MNGSINSLRNLANRLRDAAAKIDTAADALENVSPFDDFWGLNSLGSDLFSENLHTNHNIAHSTNNLRSIKDVCQAYLERRKTPASLDDFARAYHVATGKTASLQTIASILSREKIFKSLGDKKYALRAWDDVGTPESSHQDSSNQPP